MLNITKERMETIIFNLIGFVDEYNAGGDKQSLSDILRFDVCLSDAELAKVLNWYDDAIGRE